MTEDQARKKWCPFVMVKSPSRGVLANNRGEAISKTGQALSTACVASDCMAWREIKTTTTVTDPPGANQVTVTFGGYCGMAGPP